MTRTTLALALVAIAACDTSAAKEKTASAASTPTVDSSHGEVAPRSSRLRSSSGSPQDTSAKTKSTAPDVVRALYVNRWKAQSWPAMHRLIAIADTTEINAFVIDMKDEFGLNYKTANREFAKNAGFAQKVPNVKALLDTLRAHDILAIARMVVFKDTVTARVHPEWRIRRPDTSAWRDKQGLAWVSPYNHGLWDYNIGVAEELAKLGFGEIQFDYIRFPEPYPSLGPQVFPGSKGAEKHDVLAAYLKEARTKLNALGVRSTADIFGLVTTVHGPLEVGQWWEKLSPTVDVILPMVYPSHYPRGSFGLERPNAEPYKTMLFALDTARLRDSTLGISTPEHVRPWIQAFTLGKPAYGPEQIKQQKQAVYDAGYDGWVLWSAGSRYEPFIPALEKTLESRKKK